MNAGGVIMPSSECYRSLLLGMLVFASLVGGYLITSYILLKYPTLIHKKKKLAFRAVHISHRGGAGENLENTLTAFYHAQTQGTDMFEIDCHLTSDGHVVLSHDDCLQRTTGHNIKVSETTYKNLPELKSALRLDFKMGHTTVSKSEDRRIPLLKELFEKFPDTAVNIDIKVDNSDLIKKVSELVKQYNREHLTIWGNRSDIITRKCYQENPSIPLLFSVKQVLRLLVLYYTGLLPFIPLKEMALEVIMPSPLLRDQTFRRRFGWEVCAILRLCDFLLMNGSLFKHLSARGIQTYLWVLNDEVDFERAFRLGATGVMTDFPTKLRQFLDKNCQSA